jgi:hypothetical protein
MVDIGFGGFMVVYLIGNDFWFGESKLAINLCSLVM